MSKYYVRETLGDMTREVGYDTLAEVNDRLSELESSEYKSKHKRRLLTAEMIREAALKFFANHVVINVPFTQAEIRETNPAKAAVMNAFLSDLADMLNAELSK